MCPKPLGPSILDIQLLLNKEHLSLFSSGNRQSVKFKFKKPEKKRNLNLKCFSERICSIVEGLLDRVAALELQEELGLLRSRHHPHLHQAHFRLQPSKLFENKFERFFDFVFVPLMTKVRRLVRNIASFHKLSS
jgi:hypothetical protein